MNKKLITALVALSLIVPTTANAALKNQSDRPTVAILDTAIDTSLPLFNGKIIQEVCLTEWTTCPNGMSYMEGPGAASMPAALISKNGFDHGTQMVSTFITNNPNVDVVFIKIIGNTSTGARQTAGEASVYNALRWVKQNASKYNIQAVTMSQGHHNLGAAGTDYCPKTPITEQSIKDLAAMEIPVFFPVGNGGDYKRIDWPACLDVSISVGAVDRSPFIAGNTNYDDSKVDMFTTGYVTVPSVGNVVKNIAGSSAATQVAAAKWLEVKSKTSLSMNDILTAFKSTSISVQGKVGTFKKLIDVNAAISYKPTNVVDEAAKLLAEQAAAKAALKAQVDAAIAAAEAQYQIELKAAQDKLAATKTTWLAKLNG